jgi:hypothetical protein
VIYLDAPTAIVLVIAAVYGAERIFVDLIRVIDRRTRRKRKPPAPPSSIILP